MQHSCRARIFRSKHLPWHAVPHIYLDRIPMREQYKFQFRLVSAIERDNSFRQVLLHNVELPKQGVFLSKDPELLRQISYF